MKTKTQKYTVRFSATNARTGKQVKMVMRNIGAVDTYAAMDVVRARFGAKYDDFINVVVRFGAAVKGPKVSKLALRVARNAGSEESGIELDSEDPNNESPFGGE